MYLVKIDFFFIFGCCLLPEKFSDCQNIALPDLGRGLQPLIPPDLTPNMAPVTEQDLGYCGLYVFHQCAKSGHRMQRRGDLLNDSRSRLKLARSDAVSVSLRESALRLNVGLNDGRNDISFIYLFIDFSMTFDKSKRRWHISHSFPQRFITKNLSQLFRRKLQNWRVWALILFWNWRNIKHLLTYLLTYLHTKRMAIIRWWSLIWLKSN